MKLLLIVKTNLEKSSHPAFLVMKFPVLQHARYAKNLIPVMKNVPISYFAMIVIFLTIILEIATIIMMVIMMIIVVDTGGGNNYYKITQEQLEKAAKETIQKINQNYGTSMAVCNIGVQTLFKKIYGSNPMSNLCANQMINYWQNSPNWEAITMKEAISHTKNGHFVVAGWINPFTNGSGHVVVIMPGSGYSPDWDEDVPNSMDTGNNHRWISQRISFSFSAKKKDNILYFYYKK